MGLYWQEKSQVAGQVVQILFVPDIFVLERTNGIEEILDVLMLTVEWLGNEKSA
jgi:hypothetical protein